MKLSPEFSSFQVLSDTVLEIAARSIRNEAEGKRLSGDIRGMERRGDALEKRLAKADRQINHLFHQIFDIIERLDAAGAYPEARGGESVPAVPADPADPACESVAEAVSRLLPKSPVSGLED